MISPARCKSSFLGHAVDDTAHASASEDHGVGALQSLHSIEIVKIAKVLDIVAHAIDEEVCRRAVAPDDHLVPIVFALEP